MRLFRCPMFVRSTLLSILSLLSIPLAATAEVTVKATLSRPSITVGESVQLQLDITGHRGDVSPPTVRIEGIDAVHVGQRYGSTTNFDGTRWQITSNTLHAYQLTPQQAGDFTIPPIAVAVDGRTYKTQPIALKVEKGTAPRGNTGNTDAAEGTLAFAELIVPRKTAFLGEVLTVELDFHLDPNVPAEMEQMPEIRGTGFTAQKMPQPAQQASRKNGREWKTVTFRTAISPSKAGKITLGPVEIPFVAQVPQRRRAPRDLFDSFFNDPFFDRMRGERRAYRVEAPAVEIDVKPLPAQGRPKDFSGAIGQFKFSVEGTPKEVKIGDPVTMRSKITGTGNFDRMQAPTLVDPKGWHAYPVSESFEPVDDLKTTGTKTFEMPVVPETNQRQMPQFQFAFFDPEKAEYVTLTSAPAALTVEGTPTPPTPPPTPAEPSPTAMRSPSAPAADPAAPSAADILGLRYDLGTHRSTFEPLFGRRAFWLAQLLPVAVLCALVGARFLQRDPRAARAGAWQRERDRLWQRLRRVNGDADFYEMAARLVQVETALRTGIDPAGVDAVMARRASAVDDETAAQIEEIFNARAELLYAGSAPAGRTLPQDDRARVLAALDRFTKSHG